uniref:Uncharacterized protein n=1 Tax=Arundo donax TaxID=35708 RepID=A0A0A9E5B5_ARUDO
MAELLLDKYKGHEIASMTKGSVWRCNDFSKALVYFQFWVQLLVGRVPFCIRTAKPH